MTERKDFLDEIRKLEERVGALTQENRLLTERLDWQGEETFEMAGATMAIRKEDAELLARYTKQNTLLVTFVEKVADSQSKFGKEARDLLGF